MSEITPAVIAAHPCSFWHRRMYRRFAELGKSHVTCGKPWADHGELGECPAPNAPGVKGSADA